MRIIAVILLALFAHPIFADESYEFYKFNCSAVIPSFEIERVSYWNIRQAIWTEDNDWVKHVELLKRLERENNMYVFNEWYGYFDASKVIFNCENFQATVSYSKRHRESGPVGSEEPVRKNASISITSKGREIVQELDLELISKVSIYKDDAGLVFAAYCAGKNCTEHHIENIEPLSNEGFYG